MVGPQSFLSHRRFLHLKWSLALLAAAGAAYWLYYTFIEQVEQPSGGTPFGYALGALCTALIVWLAVFGVRKRSYASSLGSLRGWLSGHVYLGMTLLVLVPLHSGFQLGWNVHTLSYALMVAVIASGMIGVGLYAAVPGLMTRNRPGQKLESWLEQIADADGELRTVARELPDYFARIAALSIEETRLGGSLRQQLSGRDPSCGTRRALAELDARWEHQREWQRLSPGQREGVDRLVKLVSLKGSLVERVRRDIRYQALLAGWLLLHVPLSAATGVAVATHIVAVFYYR